MSILLFSLLTGISNHLRGSSPLKWFNRLFFVVFVGVMAGLYTYYHYSNLYFSLASSVAVYLLTWLSMAPGWGIAFSAVTGRRNLLEKEIKLIDSIARFFCKNDGSVEDNRKFGLIWMGIRSTFFYSIFIGISITKYCFGFEYILPLFFGSLVLLMGPIYWASYYYKDESRRIGISELVYGFVLGSAISLSLYVL